MSTTNTRRAFSPIRNSSSVEAYCQRHDLALDDTITPDQLTMKGINEPAFLQAVRVGNVPKESRQNNLPNYFFPRGWIS
jgi:hypothetical protein